MLPYFPPPRDEVESTRVTDKPNVRWTRFQEGFQDLGPNGPPPDDVSDEPVTVAKFNSIQGAELAKLHLAEEGIPAMVTNAEAVAMVGIAIDPIKLVVASSWLEAAEAVLARRMPVPNSAEGPERDLCLDCGLPLAMDQSKCLACGWSYVEENIQRLPDF